MHIFSARPSAEFLVKYHNSLLVSGAVTPKQQDDVIKKLTLSSSITPCLIRSVVESLVALSEGVSAGTMLYNIYKVYFLPTSHFSRRCMDMLPAEKLPQILCLAETCLNSPRSLILSPTMFPREEVLLACTSLLKSSNVKSHFQKLAFHILLQVSCSFAKLLSHVNIAPLQSYYHTLTLLLRKVIITR